MEKADLSIAMSATRLNLNARNRNGATPLDIAIANDAEPLVRLLRSRGLTCPEDERPIPDALQCCICSRLAYRCGGALFVLLLPTECECGSASLDDFCFAHLASHKPKLE